MQNEVSQKDLERQQRYETGIEILINGFGKTMEALFESPPEGELIENPFAKLDRSEQAVLAQSALITSLAQSVAANTFMFGISKEEAFKHTVNILSQYIDVYHDKFKEEIKNGKTGVGEGS